MTILLAYADPALAGPGSSHPQHALGMVVTVLPDATVLSAETRARFLVVQTNMGVAAARATYLADGADPALAQAADDAQAALDAKDPVADFLVYQSYIDARDAAEAALAAARLSRPRAVKLDIAKAPAANRNAPAALRGVLDGVAVQAKAAARQAVLDKIQERAPKLYAELEGMTTREMVDALAAKWAAAKAADRLASLDRYDDLKDAILAASRAGRKSVEDAALAGLSPPATVTLTAAQLAAATVPA